MSKPFVLITCPGCHHEMLLLQDNVIKRDLEEPHTDIYLTCIDCRKIINLIIIDALYGGDYDTTVNHILGEVDNA